MEVKAKLMGHRVSARKARLVADQIRGMPVDRALNLLKFSNKKAAAMIRKLLVSAIANAEHNDSADIDALKVERILVDQGPTQKRMSARARGSADRILKRMSHITITVAETKE